MTGKIKTTLLKIFAGAVITVVYFYAACFAGNIISFILLTFSAAFDNDIMTWALIFAPPVMFFTFLDNLLFDPLLKLFGRPALVYAVLSGNFMTFRGILIMIGGFSSWNENYLFAGKFGAILLAVPLSGLLGGVLFCFLIRLFKKIKSKEAVGSKSEKEYIK